MLRRVEDTVDVKTNVQILGRAAHLKPDQLGDPKHWAKWKESFLTSLSSAGFEAMFQPGFIMPAVGTSGYIV